MIALSAQPSIGIPAANARPAMEMAPTHAAPAAFADVLAARSPPPRSSENRAIDRGHSVAGGKALPVRHEVAERAPRQSDRSEDHDDAAPASEAEAADRLPVPAPPGLAPAQPRPALAGNAVAADTAPPATAEDMPTVTERVPTAASVPTTIAVAPTPSVDVAAIAIAEFTIAPRPPGTVVAAETHPVPEVPTPTVATVTANAVVGAQVVETSGPHGPGDKNHAAAPEAAALSLAADSPAIPPTDASGLATTTPAQPAIPVTAAAAAAAQSHDFAGLVERLVQARDTAIAAQAPQSVQASVHHAEFGAVSMTFETHGHSLAVSLASADPDFARAVQAATPITAKSLDGGASGRGMSDDHSDRARAQAQADDHRRDMARQAGTAGEAAIPQRRPTRSGIFA